jgi:hypothetical protein
VKKNYKNELGWEYTVKGDTIDELGSRNKDMIGFINKNIEILKKEKETGKGNEEAQANLKG